MSSDDAGFSANNAGAAMKETGETMSGTSTTRHTDAVSIPVSQHDEASRDVKTPPQVDTPKPEAKRTKAETIVIMVALCLSLFLAALDMTITTTAIPTISAYFHSANGYIWIGAAYLLGNAAFVPTWGKISDIFGRKPVLLAAVAVFWIGSLLCALSNSIGMLIVARAIQGVGGGGVIVLPNICVADLFSMRDRGIYFSALSFVWAAASAVGPLLGGVFSQEVSWRWCFYINLPLSGAGFVVLLWFLKLHTPRTPLKSGLQAIDWIGSVLIIGGTVMLLLGLEFGGTTYAWSSATVICLIVFGVITIAAFALYEGFVAKYPIVPLHIYKYQNSLAAFGVGFTHAFTYMAGSYWLPLYFQGVLGTTVLLSGVYILLFVLVGSIASIFLGITIKKTGNFKVPIIGGMLITTLGQGLFIDFGVKTNWAKIVVFQVIAAIGISPNFQAPLIALQTNVEPCDIGAATSSFSFFRQLGTTVSVAIGGVIFNNEMANQHDTLVRELPAKLAAMLTGRNAAASVQVVGKLKGREGDVARGAFWHALQTMFIVYACICFFGFLISLFIKQKKLNEEHSEHKTGLQSLKERVTRVKDDDEKCDEK